MKEKKKNSGLWFFIIFIFVLMVGYGNQAQNENGIKTTGMSLHEGRAIGIDSAYASYDDMVELFTNGICDETATVVHGNDCTETINISDINGKVNFAIIRIACTNSNIDDFSISDFDITEEQVKACEDLGIPYGFYLYSASRNEDEAKKEADFTKSVIKKLENSLGKLKYNKLAFVIDVELSGTSDRQYPHDVTEAKVKLVQELQKEVGNNIILYAPAGILIMDMHSNPDKILELNTLQQETGINKLWLPVPKEEQFDSQAGGASIEYLEHLIEQYPSWDIIGKQEGQNLKVSNSDVFIDINTTENIKQWYK